MQVYAHTYVTCRRAQRKQFNRSCARVVAVLCKTHVATDNFTRVQRELHERPRVSLTTDLLYPLLIATSLIFFFHFPSTDLQKNTALQAAQAFQFSTVHENRVHHTTGKVSFFLCLNNSSPQPYTQTRMLSIDILSRTR